MHLNFFWCRQMLHTLGMEEGLTFDTLYQQIYDVCLALRHDEGKDESKPVESPIPFISAYEDPESGELVVFSTLLNDKYVSEQFLISHHMVIALGGDIDMDLVKEWTRAGDMVATPLPLADQIGHRAERLEALCEQLCSLFNKHNVSGFAAFEFYLDIERGLERRCYPRGPLAMGSEKYPVILGVLLMLQIKEFSWSQVVSIFSQSDEDCIKPLKYHLNELRKQDEGDESEPMELGEDGLFGDLELDEDN